MLCVCVLKRRERETESVRKKKTQCGKVSQIQKERNEEKEKLANGSVSSLLSISEEKSPAPLPTTPQRETLTRRSTVVIYILFIDIQRNRREAKNMDFSINDINVFFDTLGRVKLGLTRCVLLTYIYISRH